MDLPYECYYNTLPYWCKEIIIVESMALNIIILAMIITYIVLKIQIKKLSNEN